MPQNFYSYFINSYFNVEQNSNINMSNFNFDYILNIDLSLYPEFMNMDQFFNTATYLLNSNGQLQTMDLSINQDFIISLLSYDYYKGRQKGIITYDLANVLVYTNPDYKTLSDIPSKFGYRMLEIIATKIFGNAQDWVLVENGINFYKTDESSLITQIVTDIDNGFNNSTVLNNIFNIYKNSDSYNNQPGQHNFEFYNSIWEFPIFYTDNIGFIDGSETSNFNGPNAGGSEIDNGNYNIPILLRFYGIGSNLPTNVTASIFDLNVDLNWLAPVSDLIITGYVINWTGSGPGSGTGSRTFLLNEVTINDENCSVFFEIEPLLNITFTVSAMVGDIICPPSLPSNLVSISDSNRNLTFDDSLITNKINSIKNIINDNQTDNFEFIEILPNSPINLSIINVTSNSIYLRWQDNKYSQNYNGTYASYSLILNPSNVSGNLAINNGNNFHFNNLVPNLNYTISISTVDTSNNISIPAFINAFTGIKYANNINLLNQPNNQYLFIFTPGGLDNLSSTDYYLTIFDTNNVNVFNVSFGTSYNNGIYDSSNNIWKLLINEYLDAFTEYTFNLQVFPNTFQSNADINRELNISLQTPKNLFYDFTIDISNNNTIISWGPNDLSGNINNYSLTLLDNSGNIIINNITTTNMYYSINDLSDNINYSGTLISNSNYTSEFSFYNYKITDLSSNYIDPITQELNDYGYLEFTWNKPNDYSDDSFITQSLNILLTNFNQDEFTNTISRISIYDLFNNYDFNSDSKYFVISGKWLSSKNTKINTSISSMFNFNNIPNPFKKKQ
jgi:hypothetical protein